MKNAKSQFADLYYFLQEIIDEEGLDLTFYGWTYSGRGMFGDLCPAWYGNPHDVEVLIRKARQADSTRLVTDTFGVDQIAYCTAVSCRRDELSEADFASLDRINPGAE